ncbi:MAG: hypothetical protein EPN60_05215 [Nevskiaceae bacterium]|jgi:hypothetical protein|nr:MAG: hypothetical protein EPO48_13315 [Nevskiaceae bacterium]TAM30427.1 MAG: hypothetical protein EPN60_05215 [Nevskiaceae bacterium]
MPSQSLTTALATLALESAARTRLQQLIEARLERQDAELRQAVEQALELLPGLLRGAVRRVLGL